jgi:hypothetical protein
MFCAANIPQSNALIELIIVVYQSDKLTYTTTVASINNAVKTQVLRAGFDLFFTVGSNAKLKTNILTASTMSCQ